MTQQQGGYPMDSDVPADVITRGVAVEDGPLTTIVDGLTPGDLVTQMGMGGTFIARLPHPTRPGFRQVIWRLLDGSLSFDCLLPMQHLEGLHRSTNEERVERLRQALEVPNG